MQKHKTNIMVGVDFGRVGERAFKVALNLASRLAARLHVVHVAEPLQPEAPAMPAHDHAVERAWHELEVLEGRARDRRVWARGYLEEDAVIPGLEDAMDEITPDFVVIGSRRGRVARALTTYGRVPVIVVPPVG